MKKLDMRLKCFQGVIEQDTLFFVPEGLNAICRVDLRQKRAGIETWLDDESILLGSLFFSVILSDDWLILLPGRSEQVVIYDRKKKTLKRFDICEPKIATNEVYRREDKFYGGFVRNNNVYILASTYPAILKINIDTGETKYITDWIEGIRDRIPKEDNRCYFANGVVLDDPYVYIPGSVSGTIVGLDCNTDKTHVFQCHGVMKMVHGLIMYKEEMWVLATTDQRSSLIRWSPERGLLNEIVIDNDSSEDIYWWNPLEIDGSIYLFRSSGAVYKVDMQEEKVAACMEITKAVGGFPKMNSKYMFRLIGVYKKNIIFLNGDTGEWFEYNTVSQKIESFVLEIIEDETNDKYDIMDCNTKDLLEGKKPYMNEWDFPLTKFLNMIIQTDRLEQNDYIQEGAVANKIYERCCKNTD